ncbi:MAG: M23 family metallopeptidase [Cyanobacteriota bacterium]|nr:M23 family metallopeptidase [Cyanobacteriota bacterium]
MVMPEWGWLSRGSVLGIVGTAAIAGLLSWERPKATGEINSSAKVALNPELSAAKPKRVAIPTPALLASYAQPQDLETTPSDPDRAASTPSPSQNQPPPSRATGPVIPAAKLFATPVSLGMLAIGQAEGNYRVFREEGTLYVEQTPLYFGHTDPGNFATNYGPCSDQGRSGGNIALAEQICLERSRRQLPTNIADLKAVGIDPNRDPEALINTADLYNQASEIHSRRFPQALAMARQGGLKGVEAIAWARTASFYLNDAGELDLERGDNHAGGLLGICARENRPVTEWECVHYDQMRRTRAIASSLEAYFQIPDSSVLVSLASAPASQPANAPQATYQFPTKGRVRKGYSTAGNRSHRGVDIAASEGTPIVAAADGEVIAAGLGDQEQVVKAAGKGLGKALVLVIAHENGDRTIYAHNQRNIVTPGQKVKRGQTIARVGSTGDASYPHLYFELQQNGKSVNPLNYVRFN